MIVALLMVTGWWATLRGLNPGYFLSDDNGNYFLGMMVHNYRSLVHSGKLAFINYHQQLGNVHLGQGQGATTYPPAYVSFGLAEVLLGTDEWGIDVLVLVHWLLAAAGMGVYLKYLRVGKMMSWLGTLAWVSFPFVVGMSRTWVVVSFMLAYLPWNWWALSRFVKKPNRKNTLILGSVKLLLVLTGYLQWVALGGVVELVYLAIQIVTLNPGLSRVPTGKWVKQYGRLLVVVGLLGLPIIWPVWRTAQRSVVRANPLGYGEFVKHAVGVGDWLAAQSGIFRDGVMFDGSTYIYYMSWLWLGVTGWLWVRRKLMGKKQAEWLVFLAMSGVTFLMSTRVYGVAYLIPGLNLFRWPFKNLIVCLFFFTLSLVVGLERWSRGKRQLKRLSIVILALGIGMNLWVTWQNRGAENAFSYHTVVSPVRAGWEDLAKKNEGRVFSFGADLTADEDHTKLATFNLATVMSLYHFGGLDAILSTRVWQTIRGVPAFGTLKREFDAEIVEYLRSWGVRYWVSDATEKVEKLVKENEGMVVVWNWDGVAVAEDKRVSPLVYMGANGMEVKHTFGVNEVRAWPTDGGEVVFNVVYWPEYKAYQGKREIKVNEKAGRPVVNADSGEVRLVFVDREFWWGMVIAGVIMAVLGGKNRCWWAKGAKKVVA